MGKSDPSLDTLLCIVGEQFFYFGILNQSGSIIQSDQVKINSDFSFYKSSETIFSFLNNSIESFDFKQVKVGIANQWFCLVPKQLKTEEAQHWISKPENIAADFHMDELSQLNLAYFVPANLKSSLQSLHDNVSFNHLMTVNLKGHEGKDGVHSYKLNGLQFLQVVENDKTIYGNLVKSNSLLSDLYFSLLPFHLHEKDPHKFPFYTTTSDLELKDELRTYIKDIHKIKSSFNQTTDSNLNNEYLYQLEKLDSCVS